MRTLIVWFSFFLSALPVPAAPPDWQILEPCWFREDLPYDADSFYLEIPNGSVVHFRLYEVDAPETGNRLPDRVQAQARFFNLTRQQTIDLGNEAKEFVAFCLRDQPLTIRTVWRRVLSPDSSPRYAAHVETPWGDLGDILVELGYARPHGYKSPASASIQKILTADDTDVR